MAKNRIWELDALRGLCILGMVSFHLIYDLTELYRLVDWQLPPFWESVQVAGGAVFVVLSGLCVTLGSRTLRRGAVVFGAGMVCTLVTAALAHFGLGADTMIIRFGVLHCLGSCMLLWPLFRKLPTWALAVLGAAIPAVGAYFETLTTACTWLFPLGIVHYGFASGDYFPLAPYLGWFLLGSVLGRTLYRKQESLFPTLDRKTPLLCFCGRHSLLIYLLHQPLLAGALTLVRMIL